MGGIGSGPKLGRKPNSEAKGSVRSDGYRIISVQFDEETFQQIKERARNLNTSFGEQVRILVEWGLMDAKEDA